MFLAIVSRPDIAFAINSVSKYLNFHTLAHWKAVKRIFLYLIGTRDLGILYKSSANESELVGYCDADFARDMDTRRSTTGYVFSVANNLITWSSHREKLVTLSTMKSEYVAATIAAKEAIWIRKLSKDVGLVCEKATVLYIDNQSAIRLAKNPEFHKRTKHIKIRYYIREKVAGQEISVKYVTILNIK